MKTMWNKEEYLQWLRRGTAKKEKFAKTVQEMTKRFFRRPLSQEFLIILFSISFLGGALIKSALNDVITIGYNDYQVKNSRLAENLNRIQSEMIQKGKIAGVLENTTPQGKVCSE